MQVAGLLGLATTTTMRLDVEEYLLGLCHLRCRGHTPLLASPHLLCRAGDGVLVLV